ncbi:unnamed protein product, partial [Clonostachys rhizophaga]
MCSSYSDAASGLHASVHNNGHDFPRATKHFHLICYHAYPYAHSYAHNAKYHVKHSYKYTVAMCQTRVPYWRHTCNVARRFW